MIFSAFVKTLPMVRLQLLYSHVVTVSSEQATTEVLSRCLTSTYSVSYCSGNRLWLLVAEVTTSEVFRAEP